MTPYYSDAAVTIYHGDARDVLPSLTEIGDVLLTDPPYSSGGLQEMSRSGGSIGARGDTEIAFDNLSTRGYRLLLREVLRYCNQAPTAYVFTDWRMWVEAFDVVEGAGWRVRNMLVWNKVAFGMGRPWRNQHELILYASRISDPGGGRLGNVLDFRRAKGGNHPTEKPVELLMAILSNTPEGSVIDPFMGSGSTLVAAKATSRRAIGIEIDERYCEIAARRCSQEVLGLDAA